MNQYALFTKAHDIYTALVEKLSTAHHSLSMPNVAFDRGVLLRNKKDIANLCILLFAKSYRAVFGLTVIEKGFKSLPSGAKIIAINHTNASDVIFLPLVFSGMPRFVMQGDLLEIPVAGGLLKETGQIPVDPENPQAAFYQARECLLRGETILVFPEGQLVPYGQRVKAKSGAVRLSLLTGAPIIPLGIYTNPQHVSAIKIHRKGSERTGLYQFKGSSHLRFGAAWRPDPLNKKPAQIHMMTEELMDQIYALVEQGRKAPQNPRMHENSAGSFIMSLGRFFTGYGRTSV